MKIATIIVLSYFASHHFSSPKQSQANLCNEGIDPAHILLSGNTVIDALLDVTERLRTDEILIFGSGEESGALHANFRLPSSVDYTTFLRATCMFTRDDYSKNVSFRLHLLGWAKLSTTISRK